MGGGGGLLSSALGVRSSVFGVSRGRHPAEVTARRVTTGNTENTENDTRGGRLPQASVFSTTEITKRTENEVPIGPPLFNGAWLVFTKGSEITKNGTYGGAHRRK